MLILTRKEGQRILIPGLGISIMITRIRGDLVQVGIDAPKEVRVIRAELKAMPSEGYESTGNELRDRILALIPDHPEILEMDDCFKLLQVEGFKCDDLQPSLAQAGWAMRSAQRLFRERNGVSA